MGQRLLLVDSDRSFLKEHQVSLEAAFDLEVANSPEGVAARLERGDFSAVLICVEVADNKGYALCSTLRKQAALNDLKIALISAKATEEEYRRHQSLKGKADLYLHKPIAPSALVAALAPLVPNRAVDPDNPLGDLGDSELGDDWLDGMKGAMAAPAPAPAPSATLPAPARTPASALAQAPAPPAARPTTPAPGRATRPPDTTHAHLLEEQVVALREELRVKDQQLREAEEYLHQQIGTATQNLDEAAARDRDLVVAQMEARDAQEKARLLQQELAGLEAAMKNQGRDQADLQARLRQLESELGASRARTQELEKQLQADRQEILRLTGQVSELRQQVDESAVQHDGERLELMHGLDQKDEELSRATKTLADQREAQAILEREKQAAEGQLSEHRDRLRNLDALLKEIQERLKRGSDLARG